MVPHGPAGRQGEFSVTHGALAQQAGRQADNREPRGLSRGRPRQLLVAWLLACAVSGFPYCLLGLPGCMNARPACVGVWLASHGRYLLRARLSCRLQVYLCLFVKCYRRCVYMLPAILLPRTCRARVTRTLYRVIQARAFLSACYPLCAATCERRDRQRAQAREAASQARADGETCRRTHGRLPLHHSCCPACHGWSN